LTKRTRYGHWAQAAMGTSMNSMFTPILAIQGRNLIIAAHLASWIALLPLDMLAGHVAGQKI
jgi:hypothetical protein